MQTIPAHTPIAQAAQHLTQSGQDYLVVTDTAEVQASTILGIITSRDLKLAQQYGFSDAPVAQHLRRNVATVAPTTPHAELRHHLNQENIEYFIVVEAQQPVEVLTRFQLLQPTTADFPDPQTQLQPATWQLLEQLAAAAEARGWQLYMVGGVVRDLWLAAHSDRQFQFKDIDLVVEGADAAEAQAGVELAKTIQEQYPDAKLTTHGAFQTAALTWDNDPELGNLGDNLGVDIATARTEHYAYPAANPTVEASSIQQDLYRRDFTINAMALGLTAPHKGQVLDFFGGVPDLRSRRIRILHPNSFIEDPTRIFRAVRFATRLGFSLDLHSEASVNYAIASGIYARSLAQHPKAPALTTRLKAELQTVLQVPYSQPALKLLTHLKAWHCLYPDLQLTSKQRQQLHQLKRGLYRFDPDASLNSWQLALQLILVQLPSAPAAQVARNLQLPDAVVEQVGQFGQIAAEIASHLRTDNPPSAIAAQLKLHPLPVLVLLLTQLPRYQRRWLWRYLSQWSRMQPPLNGHDLAQLGYPRGPQYRVMLNDLLNATLDGNIKNREEAMAYLAAVHPLRK
ncbi:MAG: CBS domain-containing protein [Spirulina sp. SIO3F2]|nr:CBS domain-containing protein [Spirulina sp. SIO3F2]